jgi:putative FmdB family regulatory protein
MPLYEYECDACGQRFEIIQKFSDGPPESCTKCGKGPVRRLQSSPAFQFKGTGWYVTDYAGKGKTSDKATEKSGADAKPAEKSDKAGGDSSTASESKKSDAPAAAPAASKD